MDNNGKMNIIVVYNEKKPGKIAADQLKKLVCIKRESDDTHITDELVEVVSMEEKVYNDSSKADPLNDRVLFVDGSKAIKDLIPIAEIKFNKHGVIYSLAGPQALLTVNPKKLNDERRYKQFVDDLNDLTFQSISNVPRGMNEFKKVIFRGLLGYFKMRDDIKKQQLIYGITEFYNNHMKEFLNL